VRCSVADESDRDDDDPDRTGTYSVGSATSDGQRFRILRPHARGGLGAVFVAVDGELHREVALKQILPSRGVIHRDLKPANIIVGKYGETLVVDWGLAKAVGRADPSTGEQTIAPSSSGSSETLPGSALGTPAYMSPEQARGELNRLGPRSDVYSLGATLYCLLTGKPPFEGDNIGVILRTVQDGHFQRPSQVDPSLDKALEAVCRQTQGRARLSAGPDWRDGRGPRRP